MTQMLIYAEQDQDRALAGFLCLVRNKFGWTLLVWSASCCMVVELVAIGWELNKIKIKDYVLLSLCGKK